MRALLHAAALAGVMTVTGCAHAPAQMDVWDDYPRNVCDDLRGDGADPANGILFGPRSASYRKD